MAGMYRDTMTPDDQRYGRMTLGPFGSAPVRPDDGLDYTKPTVREAQAEYETNHMSEAAFLDKIGFYSALPDGPLQRKNEADRQAREDSFMRDEWQPWFDSLTDEQRSDYIDLANDLQTTGALFKLDEEDRHTRRLDSGSRRMTPVGSGRYSFLAGEPYIDPEDEERARQYEGVRWTPLKVFAQDWSAERQELRQFDFDDVLMMAVGGAPQKAAASKVLKFGKQARTVAAAKTVESAEKTAKLVEGLAENVKRASSAGAVSKKQQLAAGLKKLRTAQNVDTAAEAVAPAAEAAKAAEAVAPAAKAAEAVAPAAKAAEAVAPAAKAAEAVAPAAKAAEAVAPAAEAAKAAEAVAPAAKAAKVAAPAAEAAPSAEAAKAAEANPAPGVKSPTRTERDMLNRIRKLRESDHFEQYRNLRLERRRFKDGMAQRQEDIAKTLEENSNNRLNEEIERITETMRKGGASEKAIADTVQRRTRHAEEVMNTTYADLVAADEAAAAVKLAEFDRGIQSALSAMKADTVLIRNLPNAFRKAAASLKKPASAVGRFLKGTLEATAVKPGEKLNGIFVGRLGLGRRAGLSGRLTRRSLDVASTLAFDYYGVIKPTRWLYGKLADMADAANRRKLDELKVVTRAQPGPGTMTNHDPGATQVDPEQQFKEHYFRTTGRSYDSDVAFTNRFSQATGPVTNAVREVTGRLDQTRKEFFKQLSK